MVCERPDIDLHSMMKTCYFADKAHLKKYGRPVFGATYRAMRFGPVPLEIYEMAKGENYWLAELGMDSFPWELHGFRLRLAQPGNNSCQPDLGTLSESDQEELLAALAYVSTLSFDARTRATHGPDWQKAELGFMRYEDMLDDAPDKDEIIENLRSNALQLRL